MQESMLYTADLITLFVVVFFAVLGYHRGLSEELFETLSWVIGAVVVTQAWPPVVGFVNTYIPSPVTSHIITGIFLIVATLWAITKLKNFVKQWIETVSLEKSDKYLGLIFGAFKGFLILLVAYLFFHFLYQGDKPAWIQNAHVRPFFDKMAVKILDQLPTLGELRHSFGSEEPPSTQDELDELFSPLPQQQKPENSPSQDKQSPRPLFQQKDPAPVFHYDPAPRDPAQEPRIIAPAPDPKPKRKTLEEELFPDPTPLPPSEDFIPEVPPADPELFRREGEKLLDGLRESIPPALNEPEPLFPEEDVELES